MASDPVGPGDELKWISKWKNVDIDDLADYFVSFVDGISENWGEWEFYDVKNKNILAIIHQEINLNNFN